MIIEISGRHFHVTDALREHVTQKIQKMDKYALKIVAVHVIFEVQKIHQITEITVLGKNLRLTAKEKAADMYVSFDQTFHSIQLQLGKLHDRLKDHKGRRYGVKEENALEL